jgi:hypothetical protein
VGPRNRELFPRRDRGVRDRGHPSVGTGLCTEGGDAARAPRTEPRRSGHAGSAHPGDSNDELRSFWRPLAQDCGLPTGAEKAAWLADYITTSWDELGRPRGRQVVDRAVAYCDERAAAFDSSRAVLVHGDAHGWNTLDAGGGTFKFVDPEGLRSERAHDLSVPMREYNHPLLLGDTARLVRQRAELLASWCEIEPEPVWQWGFIERVSTCLANVREFEGDEGLAFLEVATRCL